VNLPAGRCIKMIIIDHTIVSDEVMKLRFACNIHACHGACCVEGDAGAPLESDEVATLADYLPAIEPFMTPEGVSHIRKNGVFDYDPEGQLVTPLIHDKECAFVFFEGENARCAIEKAYLENKIPFRKPLSCHLYPIRISRANGYDLLNYHAWYICSCALTNGKKKDIRLCRFVKEALIRKYGEKWYRKLTSGRN